MIVALTMGEQNLFESGEHHSLLIDKTTGQEIPFMAPVAADGTVLRASNTQVQKVK